MQFGGEDNIVIDKRREIIMKQNRVVITGLGAVTPLGNSVATTWENVIAGKSGIGKLTRVDASQFPAVVLSLIHI